MLLLVLSGDIQYDYYYMLCAHDLFGQSRCTHTTTVLQFPNIFLREQSAYVVFGAVTHREGFSSSGRAHAGCTQAVDKVLSSREKFVADRYDSNQRLLLMHLCCRTSSSVHATHTTMRTSYYELMRCLHVVTHTGRAYMHPLGGCTIDK